MKSTIFLVFFTLALVQVALSAEETASSIPRRQKSRNAFRINAKPEELPISNDANLDEDINLPQLPKLARKQPTYRQPSRKEVPAPEQPATQTPVVLPKLNRPFDMASLLKYIAEMPTDLLTKSRQHLNELGSIFTKETPLGVLIHGIRALMENQEVTKDLSNAFTGLNDVLRGLSGSGMFASTMINRLASNFDVKGLLDRDGQPGRGEQYGYAQDRNAKARDARARHGYA